MQLTKEKIAQVLPLSVSQAVMIVVSGLLLLTVVNFSVITLHFTQGTILSNSDVQASFAQQIKDWFASPVYNTITLVVFWLAVGLVAYSVLYWLYNIYSEVKNEVIVEKEYVSNKPNAERKRWPIIEIGLFAALVVLAILTLAILFPVWNSWFINFVFAIPGDLWGAVVYLIGSAAGITINIYLFKVVISLMLVLE